MASFTCPQLRKAPPAKPPVTFVSGAENERITNTQDMLTKQFEANASQQTTKSTWIVQWMEAGARKKAESTRTKAWQEVSCTFFNQKAWIAQQKATR